MQNSPQSTEWWALFERIKTFFEKEEIDIPDMSKGRLTAFIYHDLLHEAEAKLLEKMMGIVREYRDDGMSGFSWDDMVSRLQALAEEKK